MFTMFGLLKKKLHDMFLDRSVLPSPLTKLKGIWNEYKIKMEMKRRGVNPDDCERRTPLNIK